MSRQLVELETILQQMIVEHEKLLAHLEAQQASMKKLDVKAIDAAAQLQEASRMRIAALESRRRMVVSQIGTSLKIGQSPTISQIVAAIPQEQRLLALGDRLRTLATGISARTQVVGRLAGALLGHLNTAVRLIASAVEQAGVYTKHGVPQVSGRIGVIEAVG